MKMISHMQNTVIQTTVEQASSVVIVDIRRAVVQVRHRAGRTHLLLQLLVSFLVVGGRQRTMAVGRGCRVGQVQVGVGVRVVVGRAAAVGGRRCHGSCKLGALVHSFLQLKLFH